MKGKYLLTTILLSFSLKSLTAQKIASRTFDQLQSRRGKFYVNQKGNHIGCDRIMECFAFNVVFYKVSYDPTNQQFRIDGTIYVDGTEKDSIKVAGAKIYLAQPTNDTLINIREIGHTVIEKKAKNSFPDRRGDFRLEFSAGINDKLYFVHGMYGLLEYNIDEIVNRKVSL